MKMIDSDNDQTEDINQFLCNWREKIIPWDTKELEENEIIINKQLVINKPVFDINNPDENDIFIYSGYIKPGNHLIYLYDPVTNILYKKQDIYAFPNQNATF